MPIHKGTVTLETERLILRRFLPDDLISMYENCFSDTEVTKWTNYSPMTSLSEVMTSANMFTDGWLGAYRRTDRYSWAVVPKGCGLAVGRVFGMHSDDINSQIELTYELSHAYHNRGFMTEAVGAVIEFFFTEVGFKRIYAYHADKNPASGRVMQKCGMKYEGTEHNGCTCNGGVFDKLNYAIYAEDYFAKRKIDNQ